MSCVPLLPFFLPSQNMTSGATVFQFSRILNHMMDHGSNLTTETMVVASVWVFQLSLCSRPCPFLNPPYPLCYSNKFGADRPPWSVVSLCPPSAAQSSEPWCVQQQAWEDASGHQWTKLIKVISEAKSRRVVPPRKSQCSCHHPSQPRNQWRPWDPWLSCLYVVIKVRKFRTIALACGWSSWLALSDLRWVTRHCGIFREIPC